MQIFVDADACPVVDIVETIAEKYNISTTLLCDTNHILYSDCSEVIVVCAGADAVDYKLISICHKGDVVVSQDYDVAAMALGKSQKKVLSVGLFKKKLVIKTYDKENKKPVIKASICNGEQVAGFKDIHTGKIEEVMLIKNKADLDAFKKMYGIDDEIEKEY